jgi:hypothetical protein
MEEKADLYLLQEAVKDKTSFLKFADALLQNWLDECQKESFSPIDNADTDGWQNGDLASFLEAAIAWASVHPMFSDEINPWQKFAAFLHAGKFYE